MLSGLTYQQKIPEIEKSLTLVKHLKAKQEEGETVVTRYNLADTVYTKAELDVDSGIVNLWLGANVMIEYTYDEAIELLSSKEEKAKKDLEDVRLLVILCLFLFYHFLSCCCLSLSQLISTQQHLCFLLASKCAYHVPIGCARFGLY